VYLNPGLDGVISFQQTNLDKTWEDSRDYQFQTQPKELATGIQSSDKPQEPPCSSSYSNSGTQQGYEKQQPLRNSYNGDDQF
jgi:hypothetical protein